jgi:hypothetical protein
LKRLPERLSLPRIISNRLSTPALGIIRVLILGLISILHLHAQYRVDTWTTDNGLPPELNKARSDERSAFAGLFSDERS